MDALGDGPLTFVEDAELGQRVASRFQNGTVQRSWAVPQVSPQVRLFSSDGEDKTEQDDEEALQEKAKLLLKEKLKLESARYNEEKKAYDEKMTVLRKQYAKEVAQVEAETMAERERKMALGKKKVERKKAMTEEFYASIEAKKTSLEMPRAGWLHLSAAEKDKFLHDKKEAKLKRRAQRAEKISRQNLENQRTREQQIFALACEAHSWIVKDDLDDESALEDKLAEKLNEVQPITASWENVLPKHHHDSAIEYAGDDDIYYVPLLEDETEEELRAKYEEYSKIETESQE
eukprot:CAMPEP_0203788920 /NCGR_PEP_ID=MMETSP0100_2-20121128/3127_1 /ASSEMBLY_ACC=CAM_ASM_000210 /TAXON_ID=96639 /ORGANISM=" , Strain NY0313808BC1" /LENGTH=289 /DNA_ID=CAMNT_0050691741 /DNA_START=75 /DNA_END=945 /DNA_ORIENTATION=-